MTLHVYSDMLQHSDEWYAARLGIVTASVVGQLITPKTIKPATNAETRALTARLVAERITGWSDDGYVSRDMERGTFEEPIARAAYAAYRQVEVQECGFMRRDEDGWSLGWSPDGLVDDEGGIEIKSRKTAVQVATILADEVPAENMPQLQAGLFVSGRKWIDYVSFSGGLPLYVKRVLPDRHWNDAIVEAVAAFEDAATKVRALYDARVKYLGLPMTERTNFESFYNVELKL